MDISRTMAIQVDQQQHSSGKGGEEEPRTQTSPDKAVNACGKKPIQNATFHKKESELPIRRKTCALYYSSNSPCLQTIERKTKQDLKKQTFTSFD